MSSDEVSLLNDGRYKNFIATLEKVLKQFEYSSEWADLITNLVKVKKVRQKHNLILKTNLLMKIFFFFENKRLLKVIQNSNLYLNV
jgi:hypothetical protein